VTRLQADAVQRGVAILAYCLLPNHLHLIGVPVSASALSTTLRDTHTAYAAYRNHVERCTGHLWQGHFFPACWMTPIQGDRLRIFLPYLLYFSSEYYWTITIELPRLYAAHNKYGDRLLNTLTYSP